MTTTNLSTHKQALVIGATGGIGGEVARQLRDAGWQVLALQRNVSCNTETRDGIVWIRGDAMHRQDIMHAARGCSVIVHAVNPPGYQRWPELVLPMIDNSIAAAKEEGATIVLPGTVYNYGPDVFTGIGEDAPQQPCSKKGAIRVALEKRLEVASTQGVRVIIVRSGDFFGPRTRSSWFSQGLVKPGKRISTISLPGKTGVGHQWGYVPDVARTMIALLTCRETLPAFARFHMAGHWDHDGTVMAATISKIAQRHGTTPTHKKFPWWLLTLLAPCSATMRELLEMRYLWEAPVRMDNTHLIAVLGHEPHTPLDVAVHNTLLDLKCLPCIDR